MNTSERQSTGNHEAVIDKIVKQPDLIRFQITRKRKASEILVSSAPLLAAIAFLAMCAMMIWFRKYLIDIWGGTDIIVTPGLRWTVGIMLFCLMFLVFWMGSVVHRTGGFARFEQTFADLTLEWMQMHFKSSVKVTSWSVLTSSCPAVRS
ncbi:MAG: hypothetical protein GY749_02340 [Desulfobacteraceae bacterium]|nr:hypothetical protein [Desulfobacteraceae bacterium]